MSSERLILPKDPNFCDFAIALRRGDLLPGFEMRDGNSASLEEPKAWQVGLNPDLWVHEGAKFEGDDGTLWLILKGLVRAQPLKPPVMLAKTGVKDKFRFAEREYLSTQTESGVAMAQLPQLGRDEIEAMISFLDEGACPDLADEILASLPISCKQFRCQLAKGILGWTPDQKGVRWYGFNTTKILQDVLASVNLDGKTDGLGNWVEQAMRGENISVNETDLVGVDPILLIKRVFAMVDPMVWEGLALFPRKRAEIAAGTVRLLKALALFGVKVENPYGMGIVMADLMREPNEFVQRRLLECLALACTYQGAQDMVHNWENWEAIRHPEMKRAFLTALSYREWSVSEMEGWLQLLAKTGNLKSSLAYRCVVNLEQPDCFRRISRGARRFIRNLRDEYQQTLAEFEKLWRGGVDLRELMACLDKLPYPITPYLLDQLHAQRQEPPDMLGVEIEHTTVVDRQTAARLLNPRLLGLTGKPQMGIDMRLAETRTGPDEIAFNGRHLRELLDLVSHIFMATHNFKTIHIHVSDTFQAIQPVIDRYLWSMGRTNNGFEVRNAVLPFVARLEGDVLCSPLVDLEVLAAELMALYGFKDLVTGSKPMSYRGLIRFPSEPELRPLWLLVNGYAGVLTDPAILLAAVYAIFYDQAALRYYPNTRLTRELMVWDPAEGLNGLSALKGNLSDREISLVVMALAGADQSFRLLRELGEQFANRDRWPDQFKVLLFARQVLPLDEWKNWANELWDEGRLLENLRKWCKNGRTENLEVDVANFIAVFGYRQDLATYLGHWLKENVKPGEAHQKMRAALVGAWWRDGDKGRLEQEIKQWEANTRIGLWIEISQLAEGREKLAALERVRLEFEQLDPDQDIFNLIGLVAGCQVWGPGWKDLVINYLVKAKIDQGRIILDKLKEKQLSTINLEITDLKVMGLLVQKYSTHTVVKPWLKRAIRDWQRWPKTEFIKLMNQCVATAGLTSEDEIMIVTCLLDNFPIWPNQLKLTWIRWYFAMKKDRHDYRIKDLMERTLARISGKLLDGIDGDGLNKKQIKWLMSQVVEVSSPEYADLLVDLVKRGGTKLEIYGAIRRMGADARAWGYFDSALLRLCYRIDNMDYIAEFTLWLYRRALNILPFDMLRNLDLTIGVFIESLGKGVEWDRSQILNWLGRELVKHPLTKKGGEDMVAGEIMNSQDVKLSGVKTELLEWALGQRNSSITQETILREAFNDYGICMAYCVELSGALMRFDFMTVYKGFRIDNFVFRLACTHQESRSRQALEVCGSHPEVAKSLVKYKNI